MVFAIIGNAIGVHCITDNIICISFFFLKHAGELRINILRRIKGKRAPKSYRKKACNYASQLLQEKETG